MLLKELEEAILKILRGVNKKQWQDVVDGLNMIYEDGYVVLPGNESITSKEERIVVEKSVVKKKNKPKTVEVKKSHYGNCVIPIGNEDLGEQVSENEVKGNIEKSKKSKEAKSLVRQNRINPVKEIVCHCGNKFKSILDSKELGSQCTKCMREKSRNLNNE